MDETNKIKIVGIFGFIGSGKSYLTRSLRGLDEFNTISKEEVGVNWYENYGKSNFPDYNSALYSEFKKDSLFLLKRSLEFINPAKINVIDSINTPLEDSFLRANYNYLLVQIWRNKENRMQSILKGRIKIVNSSEPTDVASFTELDSLVAKYSHEGGCLHVLADSMIINNNQELYNDLFEVLKHKWK